MRFLRLPAAALVLHLRANGVPSALAVGVLVASFVTLSVGNRFGGILVYRMAMRVSTGPPGAPTRAGAA